MSSQRTRHVAVREVTQPVHDADGVLVLRPGEQFAQDVPLPEGTPWKWAVAEVPADAVDASDLVRYGMTPEAALDLVDRPEPPAADGRPSANAPKADWVEYAVTAGTDRETAESMTKLDLLAQFGPKADQA